MKIFIFTVFYVFIWDLTRAQFYGSQTVPAWSYTVQQQQQIQQQQQQQLQQQQKQLQQQQQLQQQSTDAWRRYYYQQQVQQKQIQQQQLQQLQQKQLQQQQMQQKQLQQQQLQQQQLQQQRMQQQQAATQTAYQQQVAAQNAYQQQFAAYNAAKTANAPRQSQLVGAPSAGPQYSTYYIQNQAQAAAQAQAQSQYTQQQYQQYYQQLQNQQHGQPSSQQQGYSLPQQQSNAQPQINIKPSEQPTTPAPTTTIAATGEVELEAEGLTTTTARATVVSSANKQWGKHNGASGQSAAVSKGSKTGGQPVGMSSLLGKLAIRLASKSIAAAASQNSVQVVNGAKAYPQLPPSPQQPQSEWSGLFDTTLQQQQQLGQQSWPQYQAQQWSAQQQQQYQQQQYPQQQQQQQQYPQLQNQQQYQQQPQQQHQAQLLQLDPHQSMQQPNQHWQQNQQPWQHLPQQQTPQQPWQHLPQQQTPQQLLQSSHANTQWSLQGPPNQQAALGLPQQLSASSWQSTLPLQPQGPAILDRRHQLTPHTSLGQNQRSKPPPLDIGHAHSAATETPPPPTVVTTVATPVDPWVYDPATGNGTTAIPPPEPVAHTSASVPSSTSHGHAQPAPPAPHQQSHHQQSHNQQSHHQQSHHQQSHHQPAALQPMQSDFGNYFQPLSHQQPLQPQPLQQQPLQPQPLQQQHYSQSNWQHQGPNAFSGAFGGPPPPQPPPTQNLDPFSSKFEVNGLKPTIFNPQYHAQPQQLQKTNDFSGMWGQQVPAGFNPNAPSGKVDFGSRGPNPIQLNQFLAQPTSAKESNSLSTNLDAILGTLLGVAQPKATPAATTTTTKKPAVVIPSILVSDRLNDFVLGPKKEFKSNVFNEIPVNNIAFDNLNPLAAFMGETPPPTPTTTPPAPGRNGDFLAGFIGVNKVVEKPKPQTDLPPNVYMYNNGDSQPPTTTKPAPSSDQVLSSLGTQDIGTIVQRLLSVMAEKQG